MTNVDRYLRLAETGIDEVVGAIALDLEIALDHSTYANWLLGFSTGGLALATFKVPELMASSLWAKVGLANISFFLALGALVVSVIAGVWTKRNVIRAAKLKRVQMSLIGSQKLYLLSRKRFEDDLDTMWRKIQKSAYLPEEFKLKVDALEKEDTEMVSELKLILAQELLLGLSYLIILSLSIPIPLNAAA